MSKLMKVVWICGLPEEVRLNGCHEIISDFKCATWSWIMGHLPPPDNVELHVICPTMGLKKETLEFCYKGVEWHCVRQRRHEMLFLWRRVLGAVKPIVRTISPDVIHGWGGENGFAYMATLLSKRAFVSVQGQLAFYDDAVPVCSSHIWSLGVFLERRLRRWIERYSYRHAFACVTESVLSKESLRKYYGVDSYVVHHPLRAEFLDSVLDDRCELLKSPASFLFLGSLENRKGAWDAYLALKKANVGGGRILFVGDGPLKNKLASLVEVRSDVSARDIVHLMREFQFYILPSYCDTGPTSLKEAMSQGLYPICYDNSGPKELLGQYGSGSVVPTGDVCALARSISNAVANMSECLERSMVVAEAVRNDLNPKRIWQILTSLYQG